MKLKLIIICLFVFISNSQLFEKLNEKQKIFEKNRFSQLNKNSIKENSGNFLSKLLFQAKSLIKNQKIEKKSLNLNNLLKNDVIKLHNQTISLNEIHDLLHFNKKLLKICGKNLEKCDFKSEKTILKALSNKNAVNNGNKFRFLQKNTQIPDLSHYSVENSLETNTNSGENTINLEDEKSEEASLEAAEKVIDDGYNLQNLGKINNENQDNGQNSSPSFSNGAIDYN